MVDLVRNTVFVNEMVKREAKVFRANIFLSKKNMQKRRHFARPGGAAPNSSNSPPTNITTAGTTPDTTTSPRPVSEGSPVSSSSLQKSPNIEDHNDISSLPIVMDQSDDYINFDDSWFSKWDNEGNRIA